MDNLDPNSDGQQFILCPVLDAINVKVIPLWFKPKGGGRECPVIILENVPVGYDSVLSACHFIKRPEGWLIDVTDKDIGFWRRIFGDVKYIKRPPVKIFEPNKLIFAPAPPSVLTIVRSFTDEHIKYLTKGDSIVGIEAIRACKKHAIDGAINSRGSWSVIKAAAMDRLNKNPEDVATFEYVWATGKTYNLDLHGIPNTITHDLLLKKVVERQRLTAQMEKVLPGWFKKNGTLGTLIKVNWQSRIIYSASELGGPVDERRFSEVEEIAQYLLDINCLPLSEKEIGLHATRFESANLNETDWADELDIPPLNDQERAISADVVNFPTVVTNKPNPSAKIETQPYTDVLAKLTRIHSMVNRRVEYSRTISVTIFQTLIEQSEIDFSKHGVLNSLEELIGFFASITNFESMAKVWNREHLRIRELINYLTVTPKARMHLLQIFASLESINDYIDRNQINIDNDPTFWWWHGHSFSRSPSNPYWQIFRLGSKATQPVGTGLYKSIPQASEYLYKSVMRSKIEALKIGMRENVGFIGFKTRSGPILRLGGFSEGEATNDAIETAYESLHEYEAPILWTAKQSVFTCDVIHKALTDLMVSLGIEESFATFKGKLILREHSSRIHAYYEGVDLGQIHSGAISMIWADAFLRFVNAQGFQGDIENLITKLSGNERKSDLDIGIEEDLLDQLEHLSGEVCARLGRAAENNLRNAILEPSELALWQCQELRSFLNEIQASEDLVSLLRSITLFAAQYQPYLKLSIGMKEAMRLGVNQTQLVVYGLLRYFWFRLRWSGKYTPQIQAIGQPGDIPRGELFPEDAIQWSVFEDIEALLQKTLQQSKITNHDEAMTRDLYRSPSLHR